LERESNNQITEAQTLSGSVGEKGALTFSAPGNKVRSQVTIEEETNGQDQSPSVLKLQFHFKEKNSAILVGK
jgi:hypothetical protein